VLLAIAKFAKECLPRRQNQHARRARYPEGDSKGDHPAIKLRHSFVLRHSDFVIRLDSSRPGGVQNYARTGTEAVRSSLPKLTHAPFTPRKIAFQIQ